MASALVGGEQIMVIDGRISPKGGPDCGVSSDAPHLMIAKPLERWNCRS